MMIYIMKSRCWDIGWLSGIVTRYDRFKVSILVFLLGQANKRKQVCIMQIGMCSSRECSAVATKCHLHCLRVFRAWTPSSGVLLSFVWFGSDLLPKAHHTQSSPSLWSWNRKCPFRLGWNKSHTVHSLRCQWCWSVVFSPAATSISPTQLLHPFWCSWCSSTPFSPVCPVAHLVMSACHE